MIIYQQLRSVSLVICISQIKNKQKTFKISSENICYFNSILNDLLFQSKQNYIKGILCIIRLSANRAWCNLKMILILTFIYLLTIFLMISWSLNNSKHFDLIFVQINGLEPELLILQDLDNFWVALFTFIYL